MGATMTMTHVWLWAALALVSSDSGSPRLRLRHCTDLTRADSPHPARALRRLLPLVILALFVVVFRLVETMSVVLALVMAAATASYVVTGERRRRENERALAAVSRCAGVLASSIRAGASLPKALEAAADAVNLGAIHQPLAAAVRLTQQGRSPVPALCADSAAPELRHLGTLWSVAETRGIRLVTLLDHLQQHWDSLARHRLKVNAALQGPFATALILSVLPLVGLGLGAVMGAHPLQFLTHTALGSVIMLVGVGFVCAGFLWTYHIINTARG